MVLLKYGRWEDTLFLMGCTPSKGPGMLIGLSDSLSVHSVTWGLSSLHDMNCLSPPPAGSPAPAVARQGLPGYVSVTWCLNDSNEVSRGSATTGNKKIQPQYCRWWGHPEKILSGWVETVSHYNKYLGPKLFWASDVMLSILTLIRSRWSCFKTGKLRSVRMIPVSDVATLFWTSCSFQAVLKDSCT